MLEENKFQHQKIKYREWKIDSFSFGFVYFGCNNLYFIHSFASSVTLTD